MPYRFDGHEVSVVTTMGGAALLFNRTLHKGWFRGLVHRHPVVAMSVFWTAVGCGLPLVVPHLRGAFRKAAPEDPFLA